MLSDLPQHISRGVLQADVEEDWHSQDASSSWSAHIDPWWGKIQNQIQIHIHVQIHVQTDMEKS